MAPKQGLTVLANNGYFFTCVVVYTGSTEVVKLCKDVLNCLIMPQNIQCFNLNEMVILIQFQNVEDCVRKICIILSIMTQNPKIAELPQSI